MWYNESIKRKEVNTVEEFVYGVFVEEFECAELLTLHKTKESAVEAIKKEIAGLEGEWKNETWFENFDLAYYVKKMKVHP